MNTTQQGEESQAAAETLEYYTDVPAQEVLHRIEDVLVALLQDINSGQSPTLRISRPQLNLRIHPSSGLLGIESQDPVSSVFSLSSKKGRPTLVRILKILDLVYGLLQRGERVTKRELFYMNETLFGTQKCSDSMVGLVTALLKVPRKCLNIVANTRGLVAGALSFTEEGSSITVGRRFIRIPEVLEHIDCFFLDVNYILVVEKEAVANKLLEEDFCDRNRALIVTGLGYPDYQTRGFLRRLAEEWSSLPVYILTDADPHGFEIMTVYVIGSVAMAGESDNLALTRASWLGLHFSDITGQHAGAITLTPRERRKLELLLDLPYIRCPPSSSRFSRWSEELHLMLAHNSKFEIESLYLDEGQNLTQYLEWKLDHRSWI